MKKIEFVKLATAAITNVLANYPAKTSYHEAAAFRKQVWPKINRKDWEYQKGTPGELSVSLTVFITQRLKKFHIALKDAKAATVPDQAPKPEIEQPKATSGSSIVPLSPEEEFKKACYKRQKELLAGREALALKVSNANEHMETLVALRIRCKSDLEKMDNELLLIGTMLGETTPRGSFGPPPMSSGGLFYAPIDERLFDGTRDLIVDKDGRVIFKDAGRRFTEVEMELAGSTGYLLSFASVESLLHYIKNQLDLRAGGKWHRDLVNTILCEITGRRKDYTALISYVKAKFGIS